MAKLRPARFSSLHMRTNNTDARHYSFEGTPSTYFPIE